MRTRITRGLRRALGIAVPVLALLAVNVGSAMAQTPEGTVISNTATVDWTDANGNDYTPESDVVTITVGFAAGLTLAPPGDFAPPVGAATSATFTITNDGNGDDQFQVTDPLTNSNGLVLDLGAATTTYEATLPASLGGGPVPGGPFATVADLNTALAAVDVPAGESITITVNFETLAGSSGESTDLGMTVTSVRDGTTTDTQSVTIAPGGYTVDGGADATLLPGTHTIDFTVTSSVPGSEDVDLLAALSANTAGATITSIEDVTGGTGAVAGATTTATGFAFGETRTIRVTYTLPITADPGDQVTIQLTATGQTSTESDSQDTPPVITVTRPVITVTKEISSSSDGTAAAPASVVPTDVFWYVITISNTGDANAEDVQLTDALPTEVTFQAFETTGDEALFDTVALNHNGTNPGGTVSGEMSVLAAGTSATVIIRVVVN